MKIYFYTETCTLREKGYKYVARCGVLSTQNNAISNIRMFQEIGKIFGLQIFWG